MIDGSIRRERKAEGISVSKLFYQTTHTKAIITYYLLHSSRPHLLDVARAVRSRVHNIKRHLLTRTTGKRTILSPLAAISTDEEDRLVVVVQDLKLVIAAGEDILHHSNLVSSSILDFHFRKVKTTAYSLALRVEYENDTYKYT